MFSHILVGVENIQESKAFYDATFSALGYPTPPEGQNMYFTENGIFGFGMPRNGEPATHANGGTIGFKAKSAEQVDAWHAAGVANGGTTCEDPPGQRDTGAGKFYTAYLRDPIGNKLCAIYPIR